MEKARSIVRSVESEVIKLNNAAEILSRDLKASNNLKTQGKFTTSQSFFRINQFRLFSQTNIDNFKIYDQVLNLNQAYKVKYLVTMGYVFCSSLPWPGRWVQWSSTQHQPLHLLLQVLTSVETITSMSGAVVVPDLSANPAAIKALKQFTAVNGFTKSVTQCDGHIGLLRLQAQVGSEMSLPTQVSPPYSHQSQGTVERFRKALYGQVRAIRVGLADHLRIRSDQEEGSLFPWIVQRAACQKSEFLLTFNHNPPAQ